MVLGKCKHSLSDPVVCDPFMFVFLSVVQEIGLLGIFIVLF